MQTYNPELAAKGEKAAAINEWLQREAQAVLRVIENPDVEALRQDKKLNMICLKDDYGVSDNILYGLQNLDSDNPSLFFFAARLRTNHGIIQLVKFQCTYGIYSGAAE